MIICISFFIISGLCVCYLSTVVMYEKKKISYGKIRFVLISDFIRFSVRIDEYYDIKIVRSLCLLMHEFSYIIYSFEQLHHDITHITYSLDFSFITNIYTIVKKKSNFFILLIK